MNNRRMSNNSNINVTPDLIKKNVWGVVTIAVLLIGFAFIRPLYNVWSQEMEGKAEFAKAEAKHYYSLAVTEGHPLALKRIKKGF